ncbi:hypothetical protein GCM10022226_17880 [Sphaerisporangium flaviroseum]|uniref:N-acetyltransferase domain-containing protein n=1 Tax=Sphaerisporangium flaviroseum TaxID=509199 RepID=A0ABP7HPK8_9ACTN
MTSQVMGAPAVRALRSPLESARFGRSVDRLTVPADVSCPFSAVGDAILASRADVIVCRYPAEHVDWFAKLATLGRTAVLADSLVYWRLPAGRGRRPEPAPGLRAAELTDPVVVDALVAGIFQAYGCHYLANPLFDRDGALAGYQEWARGSAAGGRCLALWDGHAGEEKGPVLALATLEDDPSRTEILLAGVVPQAQGHGLYAHLLRAVEDRALARGAAEVVISTQGHNTRVQRAWSRYGFEPVRTVLTVHLVRSGLLPGRER